MNQPLPRPIQDHIAQMRSEYQLIADKPTFLGGPDEPLRQLTERERARVHELAVAAVAAALLPSEP